MQLDLLADLTTDIRLNIGYTSDRSMLALSLTGSCASESLRLLSFLPFHQPSLKALFA